MTAISSIETVPLTRTGVASLSHSDRLVHRWLVATAACVVIALVIGGITRLTESGLSITEWRPVSGVVPPLSEGAWQAAYESYLRIPEAQTVHRGITMGAFRALYWWEWVHRLLARLVGLVIALPFFVLLARGHIRVEHQLRLANLPLLVAAQGALGWYMVQSGLSGRTSVSPYRLVAHLGLALVIFLIAVWTALDLRSPSCARERRALVVAGLAVLTILSGGFVAGLDAGHIYSTFPLMGPGVVPPGYWQLDPWWRNLFENPVAAQFNHRVLATGTAVTTWLSWWRQRHDGTGGDRWHVVATVAALQFGLGIGTLLLAVPIPLAALHQLGAVALLTTALWASRGRGAG